MAKITYEPTTTYEVVEHLRLLVTVESDIEKLFTDVDYAHDCFILIKDFDIFIEDERKEEYMDCEDLINRCKDLLIEKQSERNTYIDKLNTAMQVDIKEIFVEIREVAEEIKDTKYLKVYC